MNLGLESIKVTPRVLTRVKIWAQALKMNLKLNNLKVTHWVLTRGQDWSSSSNNEPQAKKPKVYPLSLNSRGKIWAPALTMNLGLKAARLPPES